MEKITLLTISLVIKHTELSMLNDSEFQGVAFPHKYVHEVIGCILKIRFLDESRTIRLKFGFTVRGFDFLLGIGIEINIKSVCSKVSLYANLTSTNITCIHKKDEK